jgi:hypothetical protein
LEFKTADGRRLLSRKIKIIANQTQGLSAKLGPIQRTAGKKGVIDKKYPLGPVETGADGQVVMVTRPRISISPDLGAHLSRDAIIEGCNENMTGSFFPRAG